jgi:hypothetical protein
VGFGCLYIVPYLTWALSCHTDPGPFPPSPAWSCSEFEELWITTIEAESRALGPPPGQNPLVGTGGNDGLAERDVTKDKLVQLLDEGAESATLDYKETCDLSNTQDVVELAKDVGAMQVDTGYIVFGADSPGKPTGRFTAEHAALFDEAKLRAKLRRWIAEPLDLAVAVHDHDGYRYAILHIGPNPKGCCIFTADGQHGAGKQQVTVFRKGDIFVRHGSSSERAQHHDLDRIWARAAKSWKEEARARFGEDLTAALAAAQTGQAAAAPAAALTWRIDASTFQQLVLEQLRHDDQIPLRLLTRRMWQDAATLIEQGDRDELGVLLDRLACLAGIGLDMAHPAVFDRALWTLVKVYEQGFDTDGYRMRRAPGPRLPAEELWLAVIERVLGVGALAVRHRDWPAVRDLALRAPRGEDHPSGRIENHYGNWMRHAQVRAAQANLLVEEDQKGNRLMVSLLGRALGHAIRLECLRPDLLADDDRLLSSICQFDLIACITGIGQGGAVASQFYYPNFSRYFTRRSEPAVRVLLDERSARQALFPGSDQHLADALRGLDDLARGEAFAFSGWDGFENPRILQFLQEHPQEHPPSGSR